MQQFRSPEQSGKSEQQKQMREVLPFLIIYRWSTLEQGTPRAQLSLPAQLPLLDAILSQNTLAVNSSGEAPCPNPSHIRKSSGSLRGRKVPWLLAALFSWHAKLFPPAVSGPQEPQWDKGGRDRLNRRETTLIPPRDSQRLISPNSSRPLFSLRLELRVALRFLPCGFDCKEKYFFPSCFVQGSGGDAGKILFLEVFLAIYLPVSEVSSGHERPSGTLSWRLRLKKLAAVLKTAFLCQTLCQQCLPFLSPLDLSACLRVRIWQRLALMSWLVSVKGLY